MPNRLWVADFTYVPTWTGMVYEAFVVDAFARRVIGWRVATCAQLRLSIVTWIERNSHRPRRQRALGQLTPIEFETINLAARAA